jgi:outer membrane receptor protein involved in Fe transport
MRYPLATTSAALLATLILPVSVMAQDAETEPHYEDEATELDEVIVQSTRSRRRVQDEPVRVEVLGQEEIEEKLLMRPGNISMLLAETGGLRVQVTSPGLGAANIRVQGLRGRYTQLLADGLPLYGGQASSLGLLQIAPSDLRQVEVIKGAASALYGGQALGGVVNLISRRPGDEAEGEVILNVTSRDGQDLSAYGATPFSGGWSGSILASANRQTEQDIDEDGWIDMAGYERLSARPRLFWDGDDGSSVFLTLGTMTED